MQPEVTAGGDGNRPKRLTFRRCWVYEGANRGVDLRKHGPGACRSSYYCEGAGAGSALLVVQGEVEELRWFRQFQHGQDGLLSGGGGRALRYLPGGSGPGD